MKLSISIKNLNAAIELMEPQKKGEFNLAFVETGIEKLDLELAKGKDVELKDVDIDAGLLSYKGRNVSLYIKDNGTTARFHVADCRTLQGMRASGRFERYVVTNDTSGEFNIATAYGERKASLKVCQNCLRMLNYKGCNTTTNIQSVVNDFNMAEFFATYSSIFPHMPSRQAETAETGYSEDWTKVSSHYRVDKNFICEQCNVNLRSHRHLLHVHHVSGVKSDNHLKNLKALCIDCHSKQPMHSHMPVSHSERQLINKLRNEQRLLEDLGNWQSLFDFADPGLHGVLHACKKFGTTLPEVGFYLSDSFGDLAAKIELAWPKHKFGIAISANDIEDANSEGWHVVTANEFLADYRSQAGNLRW